LSFGIPKGIVTSIGSLFSGIGGIELGLENVGLGPVRWQSEIDPFCLGILKKHWPDVPKHGDIRQLSNPEKVDIVCGGAPCQDLSDAARGRNVGLEGERSGLVFEMLRIIEEVGPRWAILENVDGAAYKRWVPVVRSGLGRIGYSSLPVRLRAFDLGGPYKGSRVFLLATADGESKSALAKHGQMAFLSAVARTRRENWGQPSPRALGVADGVPRRMDRLRVVGNSVSPPFAEVVGRMILTLSELVDS